MDNFPDKVRCLIIGSGPAGYTAAIYAARADLKPLLIQGLQPGGQLTITTDVENYPGYPKGIMGPEMMEDFKKQAERFGTDIRFGYVSSVDFKNGPPHKVVVDDVYTIMADTVIISTGASAKWLGLESEQRLNGFGVSACAVCDGFFFRGQDVAIVAVAIPHARKPATWPSSAKKFYMLVRKDVLRASKAMQHRVENTPNIEILYNAETRKSWEKKLQAGSEFSIQKRRRKNYFVSPDFLLPLDTSPTRKFLKGNLIWMKPAT
jgi:thioredoxin reductase (NADPH)